MTKGFVTRFLHHWRTRIRPASGGRLGIAVSGGLDSSVLATLIHTLKRHLGIRRIVLLHLDHGLRQAGERRADLSIVRGLAKTMRASMWAANVRVTSEGRGVETAGRAARLAFYARAVRKFRLDSVALAHHLDDRIETFFLFLLRGSGSRGLSSLRAVETVQGVRLVRPLLPFSREEIGRYCAAANIAYHEDITNRDTRFLRNRIRRDLVPMLTEWHPGFRKAMSATLDALESEDAAMSELADFVIERSRVFRNRRWVLDHRELKKWPPGLVARVLQTADRRLGGSGILGGHIHLTAAVKSILGRSEPH